MAKKINRQLINDLSKIWEPQMKRAFIQSIDKITSNAKIKLITAALERGDFEDALTHVGLDARDFRALGRTIEGSFEAGGTETALAIQTAAPKSLNMIVRFDVRNIAAENWIADRSSNLVKEITTDQQFMIRSNLRAGMTASNNPRTVALDLVGRINPRTGRREGGVIGLHSRMEAAARGYADDLNSGDPKRMRRATGLELRDKRFDKTVAKAIREGKPIPAAMRNKMIKQYRNKALKSRGDTIARTEMLEALNTSNHQAYQQAVNDGTLDETTIKRFWHTAGDERVRSSHRQIPGMNSDGVGLNEMFKTPEGPTIGPPFGPNCRCVAETEIDFLAGLT